MWLVATILVQVYCVFSVVQVAPHYSFQVFLLVVNILHVKLIINLFLADSNRNIIQCADYLWKELISSSFFLPKNVVLLTRV